MPAINKSGGDAIDAITEKNEMIRRVGPPLFRAVSRSCSLRPIKTCRKNSGSGWRK